jgi:phosphoglycolate phosphatase
MKSLCVFDFDGTLVDSMEAFADIAGKVITQHYEVPFERARTLYLQTSGVPFFEQLEILFPGDLHNPKSAQTFEILKTKRYFDYPLFEGVLEIFERLKRRGIKTAISSNNFQDLISRFVNRRRIPSDFVLGYRQGFSKGRDHFDHLKQLLSLENHQMLFVGDSLKDAEMAEHNAIEFVGKAGTFRKEDLIARFPKSQVISRLTELMTLV